MSEGKMDVIEYLTNEHREATHLLKKMQGGGVTGEQRAQMGREAIMMLVTQHYCCFTPECWIERPKRLPPHT